MKLTLKIINFLHISLTGFFATILFYPFGLFIKKRKGRILVIGRDNGRFVDNAKYFFLYLNSIHHTNISAHFLTCDKNTSGMLAKANLPYIYFPTIKAICSILKAEYIVIDSVEWIKSGKYQMASGSKLIQIWHGAPLKEIELSVHNKRLSKTSLLFGTILRIQKKIIGRYPEYDAIASSSKALTNAVFSKAFKAKKIIESGYPRNDIFFTGLKLSDKNSFYLINCDKKAINTINKAKHDNKKIVLYAPTFREKNKSIYRTDPDDTIELNRFASIENILIIIKPHPIDYKINTMDNYSNIIYYSPECDIYPLLPCIDCLITDYSSIYFDFLLIDKPIIFFPYDLREYIRNERELIFDYFDMAPGPVCFDVEALKEALKEKDCSKWALHREKVRHFVFDNVDGNASQRLFENMMKL